MPYNRRTARALLTAAEFDLFASSLDERMAGFGVPQLTRRIARSRQLRDKYRDLYRRQAVATRARTGSTRGTSGVANQRTAQKATLFGELLARFEARLVRVNAALARAAPKPSRRAPVREASRRSRPAGRQSRAQASRRSPARGLPATT